MSFTPFSWSKQAILLISIVYCYISKPLPSMAEKAKSISISSNYNHIQIKYPEHQNWISQQDSKCEEVNPIYKETYSFETENYYISICQLESNFYYHRQSKLNTAKNLLIPAKTIFDGNVFQAIDGKVVYLVGQDGDRYYSSVMLNNNEIVFEPELLPTPVAFFQYIADNEIDFSFGEIKLVTLNNLEPSQHNSWLFNEGQ